MPVTLLEMHKDFDREFRGDTVHPSTLEILDQLGLAEKVHKIPHSKVYGPSFMTSKGLFQPFDLRRLKTKFPYILMIPQSKFLELLTSEAAQYPQFRLKMGTNVYDLIRENGSICGVRYQTSETQAEMRALLTVGADGRHSRVRRLAGFEPVKTSPPMDVLWFKLPKLGTDMDAGSGLMGSIRAGRILDYRSLNKYTFCPDYVLMRHALSKDAGFLAVQRRGTAQVGVHQQVPNRREAACFARGNPAVFARGTKR